MKSNCFRVRFVLSVVSAVTFLVVFAALWQKSAVAASKSAKSGAADQSLFVSETAILQRNEGTPVGPPKKFIICHCPPGNTNNCHTIRVAESAVPAHLAHGDHLGPCTGGTNDTGHADMVICRNGHTAIVPQGPLPMGATMGPCSNTVFMCNLHLHTIAVKFDAIAGHLDKGHHFGICPGKTMICHKGHTIVVSDSALPAHLAHGDCVGYCLGAQGPLLDGVSTCGGNPQFSGNVVFD